MAGLEDYGCRKKSQVGRVGEVRVGGRKEVQSQRAGWDSKSRVQAAVWIREMGPRLEDWGKGENEGTVRWKSGNSGGGEG